MTLTGQDRGAGWRAAWKRKGRRLWGALHRSGRVAGTGGLHLPKLLPGGGSEVTYKLALGHELHCTQVPVLRHKVVLRPGRESAESSGSGRGWCQHPELSLREVGWLQVTYGNRPGPGT